MCPYPNLASHNSSCGRQYKIQCGASYDEELLKAVHASDMDDCMKQCDISQPLCSHITHHINPSQAGWYNCHLKSSVSAKPKSQTGTMAHSAAAVLERLPISQCRNNTVTIIDQKRYRVSCNDQRTLNDTYARPDSFHDKSLEECIETCRSLKSPCSAIVFDATMASGYLNCHLFSTIPPPDSSNAGYTFLYSEQLAANYIAPLPVHGQHKSWTPVAVSILVLGLLAVTAILMYWYWHKCIRSGKAKKKAN